MIAFEERAAAAAAAEAKRQQCAALQPVQYATSKSENPDEYDSDEEVTSIYSFSSSVNNAYQQHGRRNNFYFIERGRVLSNGQYRNQSPAQQVKFES